MYASKKYSVVFIFFPFSGYIGSAISFTSKKKIVYYIFLKEKFLIIMELIVKSYDLKVFPILNNSSIPLFIESNAFFM